MSELGVQWENFRGLKCDDDIIFPKLTLLLGRNNVGKSSLYAPLLMLKQTLSAQNPETALLSRGDLVDVGSYEDYIVEHNINKKLQLRIGLNSKESHLRNKNLKFPAYLETQFGSADGQRVKLLRQRILASDGSSLVTRSRSIDTEKFDLASPLLPTSKNVGRPPREITLLRGAMREEQPSGFLFDGRNALILPRNIRQDQKRWERARDWYDSAFDLYELQSLVRRFVLELLEGISYIGPLRHASQRTYQLAAEMPEGVGRDGESTADILFRQRDTALIEQVNHWMTHLGYGELDFNQLGDDYFQVNLLGQAGVKVNVAHTGTGVSQILPIVTQGLMSSRNTTLITQQPEIHLNPAQQTSVMDFFIDRAKAGIRVIAETHSEHLLLRLRRRIAEGAISAEDVGIYYVEQDHRGYSTVRHVDLGTSGELSQDDWPHGFFGEMMDDSFAMAIAQSRSSRAGKESYGAQ